MKLKTLRIILTLSIVFTILSTSAFATYEPPTKYSAPSNVGVVFGAEDLEYDDNGRWRFDVGFSASPEIRELVKAIDNGSLEEDGYNSFDVSVEGDYKLDDGKWRSELPGYDDWVSSQDCNFSDIEGGWTSSWGIYEGYFDEVIPEGILPGGKAYYDNHTRTFRVRLFISFYNSNTGDFQYYSPWSEVVSYTNNQKIEDPEALLNHVPELVSVELKKYDNGEQYLDFRASKAHDDIQFLNSISNDRVYTNVWLKVNGGEWFDAGTYLGMKEQFNIDANDYFGNTDKYDAAIFDAKYRYSFDYDFYPAAGKTGDIFSPFSNVISHGMPAYEGASSWAKSELDKAAEYGLITDRIKGNMAGKVTREEFAEIAVKLYEKYTGLSATVGNASFIDTNNPEILKAANLGLVTGIGNNKYAPNDLVTREQMATILLRALKVINPSADFSTADVNLFADDNLVESWARDGVYYCSKAGIVTGVGNNMFDPDGNATREQAVIVCKRAYEYFGGK